MSRLAAVPCRNATTRGCTTGSRVRREPLRGREARRRSAPDAAETAASRVRSSASAAPRAGYTRAPERGKEPLMRQRLPRAGYARVRERGREPGTPECNSDAASRVRREPLRGREARRRTAPDAAETAASRTQRRLTMSLNRDNKYKYKRGGVPHWDIPDARQHITFRLSDSLSQSQLNIFKKQVEDNPPSSRDYYLNRDIEEWINRGIGSCILKIPELAQCVIDSLYCFNDERYHLFHWVVMPNHIHVLIQEFPQNPLCDIVNYWKRYTNVRFNEILLNLKTSNRFPNGYIDNILNTFNGSYWILDYWDVLIRSNNHFRLESKYIAENPVRAKLVERAEDYPWSSFYKQ